MGAHAVHRAPVASSPSSLWEPEVSSRIVRYIDALTHNTSIEEHAHVQSVFLLLFVGEGPNEVDTLRTER